MARRTVLTSRQRSALFALPQREADLLHHYTLSDEGASIRRSASTSASAQSRSIVVVAGRMVRVPRQASTNLRTRSSFDCACSASSRSRSTSSRVPPGLRRGLEHLLETADAGVTRFVWFRQFEPGSNSADANRLLDRLDHLQRLDVPDGLFQGIPPHRITRLRRQGERYFADGLRELPDNRRLAILAVCAGEWEVFSRRRGGGDPRPARWQNVPRSRPGLRSAARGRDGRGPRGAPGIRRAGDGAARRPGTPARLSTR